MGWLVGGQNQAQTGLPVEPEEAVKSREEKEGLLQSIWQVVQKVNEETVAQGRISRDRIIVTSPTKPLPRVTKSTIQQRATLELYQHEIRNLFSEERFALEHRTHINSEIELDILEPATVLRALRVLFSEETGGGGVSVENNDDLFRLGFDSLQAANLSRRMNRLLGRSALNPRIIYSNPTLRQLTDFITSKERSGSASQTEAMQSYFDRLASNLLARVRRAEQPMAPVVMIVGPTGSLGPHLLDSLLVYLDTKKVYCLNRKPDAEARQRKQHLELGLVSDFSKTYFFHAVLDPEDFGLSRDEFQILLNETMRIIYNAWPVNFYLTLDSFAQPLRA